jgi:hypothetical protein
MKKLLALAAAFGLLTAVITGCSMVDSMSQSHHENHATVADMPVSLDKLSASIEKTLPNCGFKVSKTKDNILEKEFSGSDITITAKKLTDNSSKIYIRAGFGGDSVKEGTILTELKKDLGVK